MRRWLNCNALGWLACMIKKVIHKPRKIFLGVVKGCPDLVPLHPKLVLLKAKGMFVVLDVGQAWGKTLQWQRSSRNPQKGC